MKEGHELCFMNPHRPITETHHLTGGTPFRAGYSLSRSEKIGYWGTRSTGGRFAPEGSSSPAFLNSEPWFAYEALVPPDPRLSAG